MRNIIFPLPQPLPYVELMSVNGQILTKLSPSEMSFNFKGVQL